MQPRDSQRECWLTGFACTADHARILRERPGPSVTPDRMARAAVPQFTGSARGTRLGAAIQIHARSS